MADKMVCPACGSYTSSILRAFQEGQPCPSCGLSSQAAGEILDVQERRANEQLKAQLETAITERDRAQSEARRLAVHLDRIKRAVKDAPDDDGGP
ncbi:MAG TPA: hypothetical protein VFR23_23260 [Jiangellaceae bacterium]|nr:hypothetical protein [Jiangellaceae bacterium]